MNINDMNDDDSHDSSGFADYLVDAALFLAFVIIGLGVIYLTTGFV